MASENRLKKSQQRNFDKDPFVFGRKLFEKKLGGEPQFTAEQAFAFFSAGYRDAGRETSYTPMEAMTRPPLPSELFSLACPSLADLRTSAWSKRNAAAPGLSRLPYVLYKRCPCVLVTVHKIVGKFGFP